MRLKPVLLLFLVVVSESFTVAQSSVRELMTHMESLEQNLYAPVPLDIFKDEKNELKILNALEKYSKANVVEVRVKAYYITARIGQKSTNPAVRSQVVHKLTLGLYDTDSGIRANSTHALTRFNAAEFSKVDRDSISACIKPSTQHLDEILRIAGYLQLSSQHGKINSLIKSNTSQKVKWAGQLALARMGQDEAITSILSQLNKATIDDDLVYKVVPGLVFTRQPDIFKFLHTIIFSDDKNCQSPDPDSNQKINCSYRVIEAIAPVIENFPFSVDSDGSLNTTDYDAALRHVREWINTNPNYKINLNSL